MKIAQRSTEAGGRVTTEQIVAAYQTTGSVWKAGRELGISGQTVHARLRAAGHKVGNPWTDDEIDELRDMVNTATIGQVADHLGRSYAAIACKINELGIGSRHGNRIKKKIPRGQGYDKASIKRHLGQLEQSGMTPTRYARKHGMTIDTFVRAIEQHFPEWWAEYRKGIAYLPESTCPQCGSSFHPSNARQIYCTRRCGERFNVDRDYFGGKRNNTIGLAEGVCQICGRTPKKGLSSHHALGKDNDPDNEFLVALCLGCHNVVTALGGRDFNETQWEALVSFCWLRRHGPEIATRPIDLHVVVDIDADDPEDDEVDLHATKRTAEPGEPTGVTVTVEEIA